MSIISSFVALFLVILFSIIVVGALFYIISRLCYTFQFRESLYKLLHAENKIYRRASWFKPKYFVFLQIVNDSFIRLLLYFLLLLLCVFYVIRL